MAIAGSHPSDPTGADEAASRSARDLSYPMAIRLFGPCEVFVHGRPLPRLRTRKGLWLLALLVLRRGAAPDRSWLAGTLWPASSERLALRSLRTALADLRRALGSEAGRVRSPTPRTLCLDLTEVPVDLLDFDAAVAAGDRRALQQALALYRGPLLEECVEVWVVPEREVREQACLRALEQLAERALADGATASAEVYLRRAVTIDPLRESAHRLLMHALAEGGNDAAALHGYRELRLLLHRELNAVPDPETVALFEALRAGRRRDDATTRRRIRPTHRPEPGAPSPDPERSDAVPRPTDAVHRTRKGSGGHTRDAAAR